MSPQSSGGVVFLTRATQLGEQGAPCGAVWYCAEGEYSEWGQMSPHPWGSRVAKSCHQDKRSVDVSVQSCLLLLTAAFPPSNCIHPSQVLSLCLLGFTTRD